MERPGRRYIWILLALGCAGCASGTRSPFQAPGTHRRIVLEVDHRYWADMTISVVRGAARARLGQVSTNARRTFTLPNDMGSPGISVHFEADPVGSDQVYRSPIVSLGDGETYVWTLAVSLEHSTLVRR